VRAIRVHHHGGPEALRLEEAPDPRPGRGEVVVRVRAAGVNPVETYLRAGTHYRVEAFPWTPGTDAAGEVEAVGPGVRDLEPGDRVYTSGSLSGTYAEKALCAEGQVHPLPARCTFEQGAAVHVPYATAWRALHGKARVLEGEVVLVHGATGGVGIAAVQIARAARCVVIGTGGTEEGRTLVRKEGADRVLDHGAPNYLDGIPAPNVILEMLADRNLARDLRVAAKHGRIVVIGSRGSIEIEPRAAMGNDLAVLGLSLFNVPREELSGIHAEIGKGLEAGILRPVVAASFPLAEAPRAHEKVMTPGALGKIVLVP
jgi:NADPH2:quinone reductase